MALLLYAHFVPVASRGLQPSTGDVWVDFSFIDDLLILVLPGDSFDRCVLLGRGAVMLKDFPFVNCLTVDGWMELESSGDGHIALPRLSCYFSSSLCPWISSLLGVHLLFLQ